MASNLHKRHALMASNLHKRSITGSHPGNRSSYMSSFSRFSGATIACISGVKESRTRRSSHQEDVYHYVIAIWLLVPGCGIPHHLRASATGLAKKSFLFRTIPELPRKVASQALRGFAPRKESSAMMSSMSVLHALGHWERGLSR